MSKRAIPITTIVLWAITIFIFGTKLLTVEGRATQQTSFAAVPGEKGGQDTYGPYEVVPNWPKPLSQLSGHEKWTWGAVTAVFAESPNRVFMLERGEIPALKRPVNTPIPQFGPGLSFPVNGEPFRNAGQGPVATPPGPESEGNEDWKGKFGVDGRWEHCLLVVNAEGDIVEEWTQWDKLFKDPHAIYISPYDPEKNVWVVDANRHAVFKFTSDGKKLLQTIGTPNEPGNDETHFNRPTFLAWLPDGIMFMGDGYNNTRVVKFDKNGKYLMSWGQKGNPPHDTRPGYFNTVHGLAVDPVTRRVYVTDRSNSRTEVFDENGKFLDQWSYGDQSSVYFLYMGVDRHLWAADATTSRMIEYDLDGHYLYSWGVNGDWPGALWGVHSFSVDQEGNLYVSEVEAGRIQKFRARPGANPDLLVGKPVRVAWK
jgi:hypothetical protein